MEDQKNISFVEKGIEGMCWQTVMPRTSDKAATMPRQRLQCALASSQKRHCHCLMQSIRIALCGGMLLVQNQVIAARARNV